MAERIREGDIVAVVSGDSRGKRGRVLRVLPDKNRVVVEGVNLVFKHLRKSQQHPQGGRIRREAPVHVSNVMPIDPETNRPTRVKSADKDGRRIRVGVRSGAEVGASVKKAAAGGKKED
ncbi:MAG: 50S ribosomal protein L24 [Planctomycetota bacterium]|nr:50S ribosomal protein L24 [Planctomycetota bacterium]